MKNNWNIVFDDLPEVQEGSENVSSDDLVKAITELKESVEILNQNLTTEEEVTTEVATEEVTEEPIPVEELPVQKKDVIVLQESVDDLSKNVDKVVKVLTIENDTEETTEKPTLTYLDDSVDTHLYMTSQVENASIDDVYTMTLSIRNICALALLLGISLFLVKGVRTALERLLNR